MRTRIDHLVIGAANLSLGTAYVRERFGVDIPFGGSHEKMGTHNHLMSIGNDMFLEVIAIAPDMKPPESPRWFSLDDPCVRQSIKDAPRLLTWVVNTRDIESLLQAAKFSFGKATGITRGNLSWRFGLPDDGRLLAAGMIPYVIQWETDSHPSKKMADLGCRLRSLDIYHSQVPWLHTILDSIGASDLVNMHTLPENRPPFLVAYIDTPNGPIELRS